MKTTSNEKTRVQESVNSFNLRQFARGYVCAIRDKLKTYSLEDEFDEWYAYCDQIDINFYMVNGVINAHAYYVNPKGDIVTDISQLVYTETIKQQTKP